MTPVERECTWTTAGRARCPATDQSEIPRSGGVAATGRQFSKHTNDRGVVVLGRFWATAALAASLVLSLLAQTAAPVTAAPPDAEPGTTSAPSDDVAADASAESDSATMPLFSSAPLPDVVGQTGEDSAARDRNASEAGSVRPRGLEAPVELNQLGGQGAESGQDAQQEIPNAESSNTAEDEERDPGDGPVKQRQTAKERDRDLLAREGEIRVWPMPADSYTFTQQFGCVPQLGSLYFPGAGCPAEAPVIHTGIDLAAPEGTLFYAAASGWVTLADYDRPTSDANTRIIIQHDGRNDRYATDYLHWIASYVKEGDYVRAGDPIGEVGSVGFSTGPHLHFSVTDLETGEHVDPVRWLPDEPGRDGYAGRRPSAQLRLPAGTTAGQPESADPAPPPPPVREDVPDEPPGDGGGRRDQAGERGDRKRDERRAEKRDESTGKTSDRTGKKRPRGDAASAASTDDAAEKTTNDRDRTRERERNKDESRSERTDSGEDGRKRDSGNESGSGKQRRDRDTAKDSGDGGKQRRGNDSNDNSGRDDGGRRDSGGRDDRGGRDAGNGEPQGQNPDSGGKDKRGGEGGKERAQSANPEGEAAGGDSAPDDTFSGSDVQPQDDGAGSRNADPSGGEESPRNRTEEIIENDAGSESTERAESGEIDAEVAA